MIAMIAMLDCRNRACSCERNWSAFDFVHSKKWNKLSAEKSAELVYIFSNLRLLRKITAGDKVEFFYMPGAQTETRVWLLVLTSGVKR